MHSNTVMHQLLLLLPRHQFDQAVLAYGGDAYVKKFSTWNQLTVLLHAQAAGKNSLRDIQTALGTQEPKLYHLGLPAVKRSTLADANATRDCRIMEKLFHLLLDRCQTIAPKHQFRFKNPVRAFDSTTLDLCLELFPWAKFRQTKGAVKLHCQLDLQGQIPSFVVMTDGKCSDIRAVKTFLDLLPDSIYVVDRGYIDFDWLRRIDDAEAFFVTRAKDNLNYRITGQQEIPLKEGLLYDRTIEITGQQTRKKYAQPLRLIGYFDADTGVTYEFLTNNVKLAAMTIARIYKARWHVELFFKWIKQHLKIKTFLGTSRNAVLTQVWVAMCYFLLLAYIKFQSRFQRSLFLLHRLIQNTLLDRLSIIDLLRLPEKKLADVKNMGPQLWLAI
jgi:Transposase DDE domain/Domain of unknown function (DUF4372)